MICGVKFCGGCNPRYERGNALEEIRRHFKGRIDFRYAEEGVRYDLLLVIGGCPSCCASHCQYEAEHDTVKMWDEGHIEDIIEKFERILEEHR
jgi:hypothetical protein